MWIFGIIVAIALLVLAAGLALDNFAKTVQGAVSGTPLPVNLQTTGGAQFPTAANPLISSVISTTQYTDALRSNTRLFTATDGSFQLAGVTPTTFDGTALNTIRGVAQSTHKTSALQNATFNTGAQQLFNPRGIILFINITAVAGAGTVTLQVQVQDPVSALWVNVPGAVTTALGAVACTTLSIMAGATVVANQQISAPISGFFRCACTIGGTSVTFSIGCVELP
jgi:hypothetical protein